MNLIVAAGILARGEPLRSLYLLLERVPQRQYGRRAISNAVDEAEEQLKRLAISLRNEADAKKADPAKRGRVKELIDELNQIGDAQDLRSKMRVREAAELLKEGWGL